MNIKNIFAGLIPFIFMIDSGGRFGIRNPFFIGVSILSLLNIISKMKLNLRTQDVVTYTILLVLIIPSIIVGLINNITVSEIFAWVFTIIGIPIFYILVQSFGISLQSYAIASIIFSSLVLSLYFGELLNVGSIMHLKNFLLSNGNGFFNVRPIGNGEVMNCYYFQGTLSLIPGAVYFITKKLYFLTFIILAALVVAPSRMGVILVVLFFIYSNKTKYFYACIVSALMAVLLFVFASNSNINSLAHNFLLLFNGEDQGVKVRLGHISSIYDNLSSSICNLLFGMGPGSSFYSIGTNNIINNSEISQLEIVRKFGIIFATFLFIVIIKYIFQKFKPSVSNQGIFYAIMCEFIVSATNPVLLSMTNILLICILVFDKNNKYRMKNT